jgi:hypothetical protein
VVSELNAFVFISVTKPFVVGIIPSKENEKGLSAKGIVARRIEMPSFSQLESIFEFFLMLNKLSHNSGT